MYAVLVRAPQKTPDCFVAALMMVKQPCLETGASTAGSTAGSQAVQPAVKPGSQGANTIMPMSDFAIAEGILPLPPNHDSRLTVALSVVGGKMMDQLWRTVSTHIVNQWPSLPLVWIRYACVANSVAETLRAWIRL